MVINGFPLLSENSGGNKAATQGNGDLAAGAFRSNGYTCRDCALLSERRDTLTARATPHSLSSRVYSRDGSQKRESVSFKGSKKISCPNNFFKKPSFIGLLAPTLLSVIDLNSKLSDKSLRNAPKISFVLPHL